MTLRNLRQFLTIPPHRRAVARGAGRADGATALSAKYRGTNLGFKCLIFYQRSKINNDKKAPLVTNSKNPIKIFSLCEFLRMLSQNH